MTVDIGTILIHPILGEMTVTQVGGSYTERVGGEFHEGKLIVTRFDRLIKGVKWRTKVGDNLVSELRFHEIYLDKLQVKNGD